MVNRLRFINTSAISQFFVWVEKHNVQVVEVDGVLVTSKETAGFVIAPGQRVSVLITSLKTAPSEGYSRINVARGKIF